MARVAQNLAGPRDVRLQLERILASPSFAASERMRRFLRLVVEREIAGRGGELKEYTLGVEVFDRPADYDPRIDPIVRVEARRLRSKLEAYYRGEGSGDPLAIELPKGTYVPRFSKRGEPDVPEAARTGIAVLPFTNSSGNPDTEYLCDGLTQQIIHRLTRIPGLRVLGWQSTSRMREREDLPAIGHELSARWLLTGTVRAAATRLRIFAQLVNVETGEFIWSGSWDRPSEDLFTIEEEIAGSIVEALQVRFGISRPAAANAEAYDLYFRARYLWNKRTADGLLRSVGLLREALDLDREFALAWAGLADSYVLLADYGIARPEEVIQPARCAAERALQLAPTLGEAEATLALIRSTHDWEWDAAERHYRRAMELNPGYATTFHWFALDYCALRGRHAEAARALNRASEIDPLSCIIREGRGYLALLARRYKEAIQEHERLISFDPAFFKAYTSLGRALIQVGDPAGGIRVLNKGQELLGTELPGILGPLGQAHALLGQGDRAREYLARLHSMARSRFVPATCFAVVHLGLGEYGEAIRWIERGCEARELSVSALGVHPLYDPLRAEPSFQTLVDRVGALP